jgi:hypothetical protein
MNRSRSSRGKAPQRRGVRIEQRPQDRRKGRFRRTLLARQDDHRIGTAIAQASQSPGDHQHEIGIGLDVEERTQGFDRAAAHRDRHRLHAGRAAKANGRVVDDAPAGGVHLHRAPCFIAEVEIEPAVEPADANMDLPFRRIEMRLGLDDVQRRLKRFRTWRTAHLLEESAGEPAAEALAADRPGFAMAIDIEVGEAGAVRCVEQFGGLGEADQDIGLRRPAPACIAIFLGDGVIEGRHPASGLLQLRAQRLEGGAVVRLERRERFQRLRYEGRARIVRRLLGQSGEWIGNLLGNVDGVGDQLIGFKDGVRVHRAPSVKKGVGTLSRSLKSMP